MATPTASKTRLSGIPTPGKSTHIPTPGRPRSASSSAQQHPQVHDDEFISQAFADAIKANDPAHHRSSLASDASAASLSPSSAASQSGRRSVNARPSSSASSSSALSSGPSRHPVSQAKPPRPQSRQSDVFARSSSRTGRLFDIGDHVRIESLGFEGILRYLGEIDGKPGLWAGVELSGGFAGKGKNNGSVGGKQYFSCAPSCGVFVASTKLSAPTVGHVPSSRPSSVASTRNGRVTPSLSGRVTPSSGMARNQNGRKTPSISMGSGRVTPSTASNGRVTPSASTGRRTPSLPAPSRTRTTTTPSSANPVTPGRNTSLQSTITPGSRASKYVGMTAKQLNSRSVGAHSPTQKSSRMGSPARSSGMASPTPPPGSVSSPTRATASPFNTPRAGTSGRISGIGLGNPSTTPSKIRPSASTPRARVPSSVAMPPPPSPSLLSLRDRSISLNDPPKDPRSLSDIESSNKALQDRIAELMSGKSAPSAPRPESSASSVSMDAPAISQSQLHQLQVKLEAVEKDHETLKLAAERERQESMEQLKRLRSERERDAARIVEVEASSRSQERLLAEKDNTIESLQRAAQQASLDIDMAKSDAEARLKEIQSKLDDKETLMAQLKELIAAKEGLESENDAVVRAKDAEIALLETRVQKVSAEREEERKDLEGQVEELRRAGQETIALYEERLSVADGKRFDLEDLVASLQEQIRSQAASVSPTLASPHTKSALEIDNETLRDQVQHLQKKINTLEDQLEDTQALFEREEAAVHDRVKRYKEREEELRQEIQTGHDEMQRVSKSEEVARQRVDEIEEALRENTVALENARAEVEVLRHEVAALEAVTAGDGSAGSDRLNERARLMDEVSQLKEQLAARTGGASDTDVGQLQEDLAALRSQLADLQQRYDEREAELAKEREAVADLQLLVDERSADLEAMRKKLNRDLPINGHDSAKGIPASPSKHDLAAARDEITGLKHIVQELQKENSAAAQRNKVLESENRLLLSETEQLREDLRLLEENVEQSILREEHALQNEGITSPSLTGDVADLQKGLKDMKAKYEADTEALRKKQMEVEMKTARTIHDLNKEIGELETLIESKIYREDELEREVERLKEKLSRNQKKSSKTGLPLAEELAASPRPASIASVASSTKTSSIASAGAGEEVCEICERPGHDIFTCDLLKGDGARIPLGPSSAASGAGGDEELVCEDCEGRGHTAANCPHSLDVF